MLKNFRLVAIINQKKEWELREVLLDDSLHETLVDGWAEQYNTFMDRTEQIDFNRFTFGYEPNDDEVFRICSFLLPPWLADRDSENIMNTEQVHINENLVHSIKGMVGFARNDKDNDNELMLFQHFNRAQIIRPGGWIMMMRGQERHTYTSIEDSAFRLNNKLTAVYSSKNEKLLFYSLYNAQKFIPSLKTYSYNLSDEVIDNLLSHNSFECEDDDKAKVTKIKDRTIRKEFSILNMSGNLNRISVKNVQRVSNKYNLGIQCRADKIVVPTDNKQVKTLLLLLNEKIYRGELTDTDFQANSKRPLTIST